MRQIPLFFRRLQVPLAGITLGALFLYSPWGESWSRLNYDLLFSIWDRQGVPDDVIIIAIDEQSLGVINHPWPWPRSLHAKLLDKLFSAGARTVAFDMLFTEPQSEQEDCIFGDAIRRHDGVILARDKQVIRDGDYELEQQITPVPELLSDKTLTGYTRFPVDDDGFIRHLELGEDKEPLSLVAASHFLGKPLETVCQENLPGFPETTSWRIHYFGPPRTIPTVFYYQALNLETDLPKDIFRNKLVVIGLSTQGAASANERGPDHYPTPHTRWGNGYMAGVEIHANIMASILSKKMIREIDISWVIIGGMLLGSFGGLLFTYIRPFLSGVITLFCVMMLALAEYFLFRDLTLCFALSYSIQPLINAYLASPVYLYAQGRKDRAFIKEAFSRYVSAKVVNQLLHDPSRLKIGGERVTGTVVFLDLAGFTTLSESLPAEELVDVLNRYLGHFSSVILRLDGMIDKYIGDSVMAVWGIPIAQEDHAKRACSAMLEICHSMEELNARERELTGVSVALRVAINSGEMIAGNVGGGQHVNYTVLGDEVNLCSRLEGANKVYGTRLIIGESTARLLENDFILRELDVIQVLGQSKPVAIYELQGIVDGSASVLRELNELFADARQAYLNREFYEAITKFSLVVSRFPDDAASETYMKRAEEFLEIPPPAKWDGVYRMITK